MPPGFSPAMPQEVSVLQRPLLILLALAPCAVSIVAEEPDELLADFQIVQNGHSGKGVQRFAVPNTTVKNLNTFFVEDKTKRTTAYDAGKRIYTLTSTFNCAAGASGLVFTDVTVSPVLLEYVPASIPKPELIEATLTPNAVVGPCPSATPVMTGLFRIKLPSRQTFGFWIGLMGGSQPAKDDIYNTARISFQKAACQGFDPFVAPHALMLPLAVPAAGPPKKRSAIAVISGGALGDVRFSTLGALDMTQPAGPNFQPTSANQTVEVAAKAGAAAGEAEVGVTGDYHPHTAGSGWVSVAQMNGDTLVLKEPNKAKIAIFAISNSAGQGPVNITDFNAFAADLKSELNNKYFGLQSNFFFKEVKFMGSVGVPGGKNLDGTEWGYFDVLDVDSAFWTDEEEAIHKKVDEECNKPANGWACDQYPFRMYFVRTFTEPTPGTTYLGLTFSQKGIVWIADIGDTAGLPKTKNVAAHEIGHLLKVKDPGHLKTDLMYGYREDPPALPSPPPPLPCDIRRVDWQRIAAEAYGNLATKAPLPVSYAEMLSRVRQGDRDVILRLGEMGDVAQMDLLRTIDSPAARMALARLGDRAEFDRIVAELRDTDMWVQSDAVEKLAYIGGRDAVDVLEALLDETGWRVDQMPSMGDLQPIDAVLHSPLSLLAMNALREIVPNPPVNEDATGAHVSIWKQWLSENRDSIPRR